MPSDAETPKVRTASRRARITFEVAALLIGCCFAAACGADDDDDGAANEAVRRGVGAACGADTDCTEAGQTCLTDFKGGMCGIADCTSSSECPSGSVCVADPDLARNYCLLVCDDKADCNIHRGEAEEANCSSSLNEIDTGSAGGTSTGTDPKVCRPPSA